MEFTIVKLYYPNQWRKNIGDLATPEDKRFNWFLCSKRYESDIPGFYIAEISPGTRFYNEESGSNYILKNSAKLVIVDKKEIFLQPPKDIIHDLQTDKYQGLALAVECENPEGSIICPEALFGFLKNKLDIDRSNSSACPIIQYSKSNYKCIKTKIPNFPTPSDIDKILEAGYPLSIVCKVLYEDICVYTSTL